MSSPLQILLMGGGNQHPLICEELNNRGINSLYLARKHAFHYKNENFEEIQDRNKIIEYIKHRKKARVIQGPCISNNFMKNIFFRTFFKAKYRIPYYRGSDLRLGFCKPSSPSFVCTPDLLEYSSGSIFLSRCVNRIFRPMAEIKEMKEEYKDKKGIDRILGHIPTDSNRKGSYLLFKAIKELENEGYRVELKPEKKVAVSYPEMPGFYNSVDVTADQFTYMGVFGNTTIESMSCDVPSLCHVKEGYFENPEMKKGITACGTINEIKDGIQNPNRNFSWKTIRKVYSPERTVTDMLKQYDIWGVQY